ncbi:MAG: GAF domain-containing protein [Spirochaetes bacterium]|nr:GAF domain-containing protein [Spirochaetota bacterium]
MGKRSLPPAKPCPERLIFTWETTANDGSVRALKRQGEGVRVLPGREFSAQKFSPLGNVLLVHRRRLEGLRQRHGKLLRHPLVRVLLCAPRRELRVPPSGVFDILDDPPESADLTLSLHRAFDDLAKTRELLEARRLLSAQEETIRKILAIGARLSQERDIETLLSAILDEAIALSNADSGSIAVLGLDTDLRKTPEAAGKLTFFLSHNHSVKIDFVRSSMEVSNRSLAGFTVLKKRCLNIPDAYEIDPEAPYQFHRAFDQKHGFRSKSMLLVPMVNAQGEVLGVISLLNKKERASKKIDYVRFKPEQVLPFTEEDERSLASLGSQATVALENALLYRDIENLFEQFVHASVSAIEARDPSTSGHTFRVTDYSLRLAQAVNSERHPKLRVRFTPAEIKELRYACLLHDFGKVAVREAVLLKAKKLEPDRLLAVVSRFELRKARVLLDAEARVRALWEDRALEDASRAKRIEAARREAAEALAGVNSERDLMLSANEPSLLTEEKSHLLNGLRDRVYPLPEGGELPLLDPAELAALSVPKGSLTLEERREIESHVTHTYKFLKAIPWTKNLARVPEIAYGHHEKMDGTGHPVGLTARDLLPQARIMAICDIFDALTAADRSYKKAIPLPDALKIIEDEVERGKLDPVLHEIFLKHRIWEDPRETHPSG